MAPSSPPVTASVFLEGLTFGEGPRWHHGRLWYSDFFSHTIFSVTVDDTVPEPRAELWVPGQPSGLGWLPDATLLAVSMKDRAVVRREVDGGAGGIDAGGIGAGGIGAVRAALHADLSAWAPFEANDMLVLDDGTAFVGQFGFDLQGFFDGEAHPAEAALLRVDTNGRVEAAAEGMSFANGMVLFSSTLVVAETFAMRLSAFDVGPGGRLGGRRTWATLDACFPDGICGDAEGAVWVANAGAPECLRVAEGGKVLERVVTSQTCFACALGGEDRRTLFCCTAPTSNSKSLAAKRVGRIEVAKVDVAGAGLP